MKICGRIILRTLKLSTKFWFDWAISKKITNGNCKHSTSIFYERAFTKIGPFVVLRPNYKQQYPNQTNIEKIFNLIQFISTIHKNTYKYKIVEIAQRIFRHTKAKPYTRQNRW